MKAKLRIFRVSHFPPSAKQQDLSNLCGHMAAAQSHLIYTGIGLKDCPFFKGFLYARGFLCTFDPASWAVDLPPSGSAEVKFGSAQPCWTEPTFFRLLAQPNEF